jgi:hypothetical protein
MIFKGEASALKGMSSGRWEFHVSYYIIKTRVITSNTTYLSGRTKPAGRPLPRSRYALSRTRGLDRGAAGRIVIYTDLFGLNFYIHFIHSYIRLRLQLQTTRTCMACPVKGEFGERWPQTERPEFPRLLPHLGILGAKVIGTRTRGIKC